MANKPEYPKALTVLNPGAKPSLDRVVVHSIDDVSLALYGNCDRNGPAVAFDVSALVPEDADLSTRAGMGAALSALAEAKSLPASVAQALGV